MRLIDYPTGYQIRIYDKVLDTVSVADDLTGSVKLKYLLKKNKDKLEDVPLPVDEWMPVEKTFEEFAQEFDEERAREQAKRQRSIYSSMNRTVNNLYYISRSNLWDYFLTFTLDPKKINRFDYLQCSKKVRQSLNNFKKSKCPDMYYLVVPERHKNGAWHFHGLLGNTKGLNFQFSGIKDKKGNSIYNLMDYKLGFTTATKVVDSGRVSNYICKYITKSLCEQTRGLQRYYVSKNCSKAVIYDALLKYKDLENLKYALIVAGCHVNCRNVDFVSTTYIEVPDKQLLNNFLHLEVLD